MSAVRAFANIGRGGNSRRAIQNVRNAVPRGFIGFAEIDEADEADEHAVLSKIFKGWKSACFSSRVPLMWKSLVWKRTGVIRVEGHPGIKHISPPRLITGATFQHRVFRKRKRAEINGHTVAGAWNADDNAHDDIRRRYWLMYWKHLCELVQDLVEQGHDTTFTGDLNRQRPPIPVEELHKRARIVQHHATDYIIAIPAKGHGVEVLESWDFPLGIDFHKGLAVRLRFPRLK